jgi:hypothetical protein
MPSYKLGLELSSGDIVGISETVQVDSSENSPVLHSGIVWIEFQLSQRLHARRLDSCLGFYISTRQITGKCFKLEHDGLFSLTLQCRILRSRDRAS